jgi:hypothetical protein
MFAPGCGRVAASVPEKGSHHSAPPLLFRVMVSRVIRANSLEYAAACSLLSRSAGDPAHRLMFHMLLQLWKSLANNCQCLTDAELAEEFKSLSDLHGRIVTLSRTALH